MFVQQVAQTCNKSTECATSRQQQVAVDSNKLHVWTGLKVSFHFAFIPF